ncbi:MAG: SMP-30/gluconolactonase/LRE family protein [Anaerolineae bacterium]
MKPEFTFIAKGLSGAEGPVFDRHGNFYMVVPWEGRVIRVSDDGRVTEFVNTGGIPAGLQCDKENNLWLADMRLGIIKIGPDGAMERVVSTFEGRPIRGCNDCSFDSQGNLYFTAPAGSDAVTPVGEVFCRRANGDVVRLDAGYHFCNGIAVTADDRGLIVAETRTKSLWWFDILAPGEVANRRLWAALPGDHEGGPDGIDFDEAGNLLSTNIGASAIEVYAPDGTWLESIETPFAKPSNVHFGGEDGAWVYVTEHTNDGLWKFHWVRRGQRQYCDR